MSFTTVIPNPPVFENPGVQIMYVNGFLTPYYGSILTLKDRSGNTISQVMCDIKDDARNPKTNRKIIQDGLFESRYGSDFIHFFKDIPSWISDVMRRNGPRRMVLKVTIAPWTPGCWLSESDWAKKGHDTLIIPTRSSKKLEEPPKKRRA